MKFRKGGDSHKAIPAPRKALITGRAMQPQPINPTNKLLGVNIVYEDVYGLRETLLVFGCDISIPANMNATMTGRFHVTLHTSAGDVTFAIMQPLGASNLSINHNI